MKAIVLISIIVVTTTVSTAQTHNIGKIDRLMAYLDVAFNYKVDNELIENLISPSLIDTPIFKEFQSASHQYRLNLGYTKELCQQDFAIKRSSQTITVTFKANDERTIWVPLDAQLGPGTIDQPKFVGYSYLNLEYNFSDFIRSTKKSDQFTIIPTSRFNTNFFKKNRLEPLYSKKVIVQNLIVYNRNQILARYYITCEYIKNTDSTARRWYITEIGRMENLPDYNTLNSVENGLSDPIDLKKNSKYWSDLGFSSNELQLKSPGQSISFIDVEHDNNTVKKLTLAFEDLTDLDLSSIRINCGNELSLDLGAMRLFLNKKVYNDFIASINEDQLIIRLNQENIKWNCSEFSGPYVGKEESSVVISYQWK